MSSLLQLNYLLFQKINAPAGSHPLFDALMIFSANLLIFCWPLLLLLVWGVPLNWRKRALSPTEEELLEQRRSVVLWVAFACLLAYAFNLLLEQFIFEPRPFVSHTVHQLITHPADSSFPSDHSAWSFAVFGLLLFSLFPAMLTALRKPSKDNQPAFRLLLAPTLLLILAFVIACTIGVARIYVGVHYPGDILGGAIDGLIAALLITLLSRWLRQPTHAVLLFAHRLRLA